MTWLFKYPIKNGTKLSIRYPWICKLQTHSIFQEFYPLKYFYASWQYGRNFTPNVSSHRALQIYKIGSCGALKHIRYLSNAASDHSEDYNVEGTTGHSPKGSLKKKTIKSNVPAQVSYEPYWTDDEIAKFEAEYPKLVIRGSVFIPAFNTSDARVVLSQDNKANGTESYQNDSSYADDVPQQMDNQNMIKLFGFLARNRSFHGDDVIAVKQRRRKNTSGENKNASKGCRIVSVVNRCPTLDKFICSFYVDDFFDEEKIFKCQPLDTRWPAFCIQKSSLTSQLNEEIARFKSKKQLFCLLKFEDWKFDEIEPTATMMEVMGDVDDPEAQMNATMIFYNMDPSEFSNDVLTNLKQLVEEGNEDRHLNRIDRRDLLVIPIDPEDAKDLDDALSIELKNDNQGNLMYQVGVHVADVSHYVKQDSLVDTCARARATSVYLEHKVYPMLPPLLSDNICSLLPGSDKLAFSMFVNLVHEPMGEQIGSGLYIKGKPEFQLTIINTRQRLSYQEAQKAIEATTVDNELLIPEYEKSLETINNGDLTQQIKKSLLRLYYVSTRLRNYRINKRGAVQVDVDGSVKCKIPKIVDNVPNFSCLKIDYTPKKSHELVEELMLLANTQAAQLLAAKFKSYFLRIHDDTSHVVKDSIIKMLPQNLLNDINPDILSVPQLIRKCAQVMEPSAFQSLSFATLQEFREAVYSPITKGEDKDTSHWGLALPTYLHFTSPIRRYSDLYTHRMLKMILDEKYSEQSLSELDAICKRCNVQKRKAFDTQKHYKNFCFNRYLQWACKVKEGKAPCQNLADFEQDHCGTWGFVYKDACIASIVIDGPDTSSIVFYIPLLNEQRSSSCKTLGIVPKIIHYDSHTESFDPSGTIRDYLARNTAQNEHEVSSLLVQCGHKELKLQRLAKTKVLLVPGAKMWGVRLCLI
ncbi:bifunctional Ribonuclease II-R/Nucleic acid-binding [Babesia duncani]|uniref:Bifunctional Ribonuclease II-R/Nucleic acid-binding n=1 Tax=Babesia duncani TaxID=323732 RepID=A0AAD9PM31_9APIC|nr:bifunctional Ribonuclease II-R/Nucleic acid-binding [Babesia duncani]